MPPPPKPLPRWLVSLLGIFSIVLCFGMALSIRVAPQWTATAQGRDVAIWLLTPHLAPGDIARVEVDVYGGKRAALQSIEVLGEGVQVRRTLAGANWGGVIVSRAGDTGHATETIELRVPDTAEPGQVLPLALAVGYTLAVSRSRGFSNMDRSETVGLRFRVLSPGERVLRRVWSGFWPLALFGAAVALLRWRWHAIAALMTRKEKGPEDGSLIASLGMLMIAAIIAWAFAGWVIFALPLVAATGFTSDWFQAAMGAVWLFAPPLLARKLAGPKPPGPMIGKLRAIEVEPERTYRAAPPDPKKPPSLKKIAAALREGMGLAVTLEEDAITTRPSRGVRPLVLRARNPKRVPPEELQMEVVGVDLAIKAVITLLPLLGPVELELVEVSIIIDGTRSAEELEKEWAGRFAEMMLKHLEAMRRALPDRVGRRG